MHNTTNPHRDTIMTKESRKPVFEPGSCDLQGNLYSSSYFDSIKPPLERPAANSKFIEVSTVFSGATDADDGLGAIDNDLRSRIVGYRGMTVRTLPPGSENENGRFLVEFRFQSPISIMFLLGVMDTQNDMDLYYTLRGCPIDDNWMETVVSRLSPKEQLEDAQQDHSFGFNGKLIWADTWIMAQAVLANFQMIHIEDEVDIYVKPYSNEAGCSGLHFIASRGDRAASVKGADNSDQVVLMLGFKNKDFDIRGTPLPSVHVVYFNEDKIYEAAQHLHTWLIETPSPQHPIHLPPASAR
jgi:hypothetical protein